jgi:isoleucyl-tRNA synthetase
MEDARRAGTIGSSLQASITLTTDNADRFLLSPAEWEEVLIVSAVDVVPGEPGSGEGTSVEFAPAPGTKCDRCWRVLPEVGVSENHPTLCRRCEAVVEALDAEVPAA